ncbi:MAG TPA: M23 family metallopeptidase [Ruminiclostridium sp.]|nr:M23 family metallopeptidase [Ruminiclostridium sp.]
MKKFLRPAYGILLLLFALTLYKFCSYSLTLQRTNEALRRQVQSLSGTLIQQNKTLEDNHKLIKTLESDEIALKNRLENFSDIYAQIAGGYILKSSRGTVLNSTSNTIEGIIKLNALVKNLSTAFHSDNGLSEKLEKSNMVLERFVDALPTFIPANGKITSPFGMRRHPITHIPTVHKGVDIDAETGDPIMAAGSGKVIFAGYSSGYGNNIIIDHNNGFTTIYGHSSKLLVKSGDTVKKGQIIALVGSTGRSTGPHLHFEIRINNTAEDPTKYVAFTSLKR